LGYAVVIGISVVRFKELVSRNKSIAADDALKALAVFHGKDEEFKTYHEVLQELKKYNSHIYGHFLELAKEKALPFAPRLPDVRDSPVNTSFKQEVRNIYDAISSEITECNRGPCPVEHMVIFKPVPISNTSPEGLGVLLHIKFRSQELHARLRAASYLQKSFDVSMSL
jgi:hypothetical protein